MKPRIILLNGPSSSGKSSLSLELRKVLEDGTGEKYEVVALDDHLVMSREETIYEEDVYAVSQALCDHVHKTIKEGCGVIIDHVITSSPIFLQLARTLEACDVYMVHIHCPVEELRRREQERDDRCIGSAEASLQYLYPQETYDLSLDTFELPPNECIRQIQTLLTHRPEAFQRAWETAEKDVTES